jgi:hypothetical protein
VLNQEVGLFAGCPHPQPKRGPYDTYDRRPIDYAIRAMRPKRGDYYNDPFCLRLMLQQPETELYPSKSGSGFSALNAVSAGLDSLAALPANI